jgi:hypothetical protein
MCVKNGTCVCLWEGSWRKRKKLTSVGEGRPVGTVCWVARGLGVRIGLRWKLVHMKVCSVGRCSKVSMRTFSSHFFMYLLSTYWMPSTGLSISLQAASPCLWQDLACLHLQLRTACKTSGFQVTKEVRTIEAWVDKQFAKASLRMWAPPEVKNLKQSPYRPLLNSDRILF